MADFFRWQADYSYFFYGLSLFILSAVSLIARKDKKTALPWVWLGLFGVALCLREWLNVLIIDLTPGIRFNGVSMFIIALSFIFLAEFGRAGIKNLRGKGPGKWILLPLPVLMGMSAVAGWSGMTSVFLYSIILAAGISAAILLLLASKEEQPVAGKWLFRAGILLGLYTVFVVIVPSNHAFPSCVFNKLVFLRTLGFPVYLVKGVLVSLAAISIWAYSLAPSEAESSFYRTRAKHTFLPVSILAIIVVAGWIFTRYADDYVKKALINERRLYISALSDHLNSRLGNVRHEFVEKMSSPAVRSALISGRAEDIEKVRLLMKECAGDANYKAPLCYVSDRNGKIIASCGQVRKSVVLSKSDQVSGFEGFHYDSLTGEQSYYISSPVKDGRGKVIGSVTVRENLREIEEGFRKYPYCFLVDPNGIIFLSSRDDFRLRSLWPLKEDVLKKISSSGQFGPGPFAPLMSKAAENERYVDVAGRQLILVRQSVGNDGWSIVVLGSTSHIRAFRLFSIFTTFVFFGLTLIFFASTYFSRASTERIMASERRYRSLVDGSPNSIMLFDRQGRCLSANMAGIAMMSYGDDIKGKKIRELFLERFGHIIDTAVRQACEGKLSSFEAENVYPDNNRLVLSGTLNPIYDPDGEIRRFVGIFMDITERRKAEDELKRYHEQLETLVEDRTTELIAVNKMLQQEISERKLAEEELRKHKDILESLVDERTKTLQVEILKSYKMSEALRESEEKFRAIASTAADAIIMMDNEGKVTYWNRAAAKMFGYQADEALGKDLHILIAPARYYAAYRDGFSRFVGTGRGPALDAVTEFFAARKDRSEFPIEISVSAIMLQGKWHAVGIIRDITERRKAREELESSHEQFRRLSAHLQSVREEDRVMIAREIHDELGQALTALKMDISWLSRRLPPGNKALIEKAESSMQLIDTTIRTIRRICTELRPEMIDHLGLAAAIEWQAAEFENRTGIKCSVLLEPEELDLGNELAIAVFRVVQEALTNIARYAKATKVDICMVREDGFLTLDVSDNGVGITEEQILGSKSFGLMGIRERMDYFGGVVEITGKSGRGTTIKVRCPLDKHGRDPDMDAYLWGL